MDIPSFVSSRYEAPIRGWCAPEVLFALEVYFQSEEAFSTPGPICEIGVHHGRFLIGAHNALRGARALGIDLFDQQQLNIDGSGHGSMEAVLANLSHAVNRSQIDLMQADSFALGSRELDEMLSRYGRFKVFGIDGGHTSAHVINDMRIAQDVTALDGVIAIDDFFSPHWPGVTEGIAVTFLNRQFRFAPFMYLENKLFLTGISYRDRALAFCHYITEALKDRIEFRPVDIFGFRCVSGVRL